MNPRSYLEIKESAEKIIILLLVAAFLIRPSHLPAIHDGAVLDVGNHVPPLEFIDLSGEQHALLWKADEGGPKGALLFFFDTYSSSSLLEMSFLRVLAPYAGEFGLRVYAIEGGGFERDEMKGAMSGDSSGYTAPSFPLVADPNYELSSVLDIRDLPTTLFIESHGVILFRMQGFDRNKAVVLARKLERGLHRTKGLFSFALREIGIGVEEERALEHRPSPFKAGRAVSKPSALAEGDKVPSLILRNLNGKRLRLEKQFHEARATVVIFWTALCQPCIRELNYLEAVYNQGVDFGLEIIAVEGGGLGFERVAEIMERYRRRYSGPSFVIVPDPDRRAAGVFGVIGNLPQTFIVNKEGTVVLQYDRFTEGDEEELAAEIEKALGLEPGTIWERLTGDLRLGGKRPEITIDS